MNPSVVPSNNDFNYYLSQGYAETARIVAGMTSIIDVNEDKLSVMQNQKWFERMWFTVSGKNKATVKEMEQNRDKLAAYSVQVFSKFIEEKRISDAIISNLTVRLNEIYSSHLQLQEIMYAIVNKLNEKINSVNNYHNLITDIQNDKYDPKKNFVSLLEILSLLDKRTVSDQKHLIRIKETMKKNGFVFSQTVSIIDFTEQILALPEESIGQVYLFAQNHTKFKFIQFACCLIEKYHFEPKSNRKIIKGSVVKISLGNCSLTGNEDCNVDEFYDDIQNSAIEKFAMLREFPAPENKFKHDPEVDAGNIKTQQPSDSPKVGEKMNNEKRKTNFEENIEKEYKRQRQAIQKPNLMVVGGTGVGKSSLINRVFGKEIATVGAGVPVTKGIVKYESEKQPVIFWDTEGYEIANDGTRDTTNFDNVIKPQIEEMNSGELNDRIHLVWYCVSIVNRRVTDYDISNIKWFKERNMKIAIVFTKCDTDEELPSGRGREASEFKAIIDKKIQGLTYFEVCAEREDIPLDLETLLEWSVEALPNAQMRESFIAAQKISIKSKKELAYKIVITASTTTALAAGLNPLPLADTLLIVPQQLAMAVSLSKIFMFDSFSETAGNLLKTQIAAIAGRQLAASFFKFVPIIGQVVSALVAGGITYALGMALTEAYSKAYERFLDTGEVPDWAVIFSSDIFVKNLTSFFKKFTDKEGTV